MLVRVSVRIGQEIITFFREEFIHMTADFIVEFVGHLSAFATCCLIALQEEHVLLCKAMSDSPFKLIVSLKHACHFIINLVVAKI